MKPPIKLLAGVSFYEKMLSSEFRKNMLIILIQKIERMQKKVYGISENLR